MKLTAKRLTAEEQTKVVQEKLDWILSQCRPEKVILFGSAARGEMTEASDLDFILLFNDFDSLKIAQKNLSHSRLPDDWPHDLLFYTLSDYQASQAKGGGAAWLAAREGKVLFSAEGNKS